MRNISRIKTSAATRKKPANTSPVKSGDCPAIIAAIRRLGLCNGITQYLLRIAAHFQAAATPLESLIGNLVNYPGLDFCAEDLRRRSLHMVSRERALTRFQLGAQLEQTRRLFGSLSAS